MNFTELGITQPLTEALNVQKITVPTDIQRLAIPPLNAGTDAYLQSETGSGKTLAYLLPLLSRIDVSSPTTQLVIVAPTHELAIQIQKLACDLSQQSKIPFRTLLLIGATAIDRQIDKLKKKPHVAVGSPGRICELVELGKLKPHTFKSIVLDEADTLLADRSLAAVQKIVKAASPSRQLIFVSATAAGQSLEEAHTLAPNMVMLKTEATPVNTNIEHLFLVCEERDKPDVLRRLIHATSPQRALVFVHRNHTAEEVAAKLAHHKIPTVDLHAAFGKEDRKRAMEALKKDAVRVMIASDVAARGLDIKGITHIFNLDAPSQTTAYIHRVGRTARAGAQGTAISLFTAAETRLTRRYEQDAGVVMREIILREGRIALSTRAALRT